MNTFSRVAQYFCSPSCTINERKYEVRGTTWQVVGFKRNQDVKNKTNIDKHSPEELKTVKLDLFSKYNKL